MAVDLALSESGVLPTRARPQHVFPPYFKNLASSASETSVRPPAFMRVSRPFDSHPLIVQGLTFPKSAAASLTDNNFSKGTVPLVSRNQRNLLQTNTQACHNLSLLSWHHNMDIRDLDRLVGKKLAEIERLRVHHPPTIVNAPIEVRCEIRPAQWNASQIADRVRLEQVLRKGIEGLRRPSDPWKIRADFLSLKRNDKKLAEFLARHGMWSKHPPTEPQNYWDFQEDLKKMLLQPREYYIFLRQALGPGVNPFRRDYQTYIEWRDAIPILVIEIDSCEDALLLSVELDRIQGAKFKRCALKTCGMPFRVVSRHRKKYHQQYCAHLASVRRAAAERRRKKKKQERRNERS